MDNFPHRHYAPAGAVRAVNISGTTANGIDYRTTLDGSFSNIGGNISAIGNDSAATALRIGNLATVPTLVNTGDILARGVDSGEDATTGASGLGGGGAFGVIVEATGNLASVVNSGPISGESHGVTQSGYAILDYSGSLRSITNSATITGTARGNGAAVAFDVSKSTGVVQFNNTGIGDMRVGDNGSNVVSTGGAITGFFLGGAGNDSVSLNGTTLFGTVNVVTSTNAVSFVNSTITGGVLLGSGGTSTLNISGSTVEIATLVGLNATQATIGTSTLTFNVNTATETGRTLKAGSVVINPGTTIKAIVTGSVTSTLHGQPDRGPGADLKSRHHHRAAIVLHHVPAQHPARGGQSQYPAVSDRAAVGAGLGTDGRPGRHL